MYCFGHPGDDSFKSLCFAKGHYRNNLKVVGIDILIPFKYPD